MREIIFRGKDVYGNWLYGDLINLTDNIKQICDHRNLAHAHGVNPETVGQYTGLTDRKGNRIYEGDIVKWDGTEISQIRYCDGVYRLCNAEGYYGVSVHNHYSYVEVIGNIHDNPELLKGGE